jgi:cytochrome P450
MTTLDAAADPRLAQFADRLVALALRQERPDRVGSFFYVGDAATAFPLLSTRGIFAKSYDCIEILGASRFSRDGEEWATRRGMTQPLLGAAGRRQNRAMMQGILAEAVAQAPVEVDGLMAALTTASTRVFFAALGVDADVVPFAAVLDSMREIMRRLQTASVFGGAPETMTALGSLAAPLRRQAELMCAAEPELQALCARMTATPGAPEGFHAPTELMFAFFAGVESTTSSMAWALERLATFAEAQERLAAEACEGLEDAPLLTAFLNEVLRFFPPIPFITRRTLAPATAGSRSYPAGADVLISILAVHRDETAWDEPLAFQPFRPAFLEDSFNRQAFLPFSAGERICGGMGMARMELTEGVAAVLRRFRVTRSTELQPFDYAMTLRPVVADTLRIAERSRADG